MGGTIPFHSLVSGEHVTTFFTPYLKFSTMAMSDDEVQRQLKQMVNFILKEAEEKAREIKIKAEEEFNIEKQRIVQEKKLKIQKEFERKEKQLESQNKIARSTELNQQGIKVLKAQEDVLQKLYEKAHARLETISADKESYKQLMRGLIFQGLLRLEEEEVNIICRDVDRSLVESVLSGAAEDYKKKNGKSVKLTVDPKNKLPPPPQGNRPGCYGGVLLSCQKGSIITSNTLETRLQQAIQLMLPQIRYTVLGANPNRAFLD